MGGDDKPWLTRLIGGLPANFDYGVIRSADDARSLILILPSHDRGTAARELLDHLCVPKPSSAAASQTDVHRQPPQQR
jgi:hypothetical protein